MRTTVAALDSFNVAITRSSSSLLSGTTGPGGRYSKMGAVDVGAWKTLRIVSMEASQDDAQMLRSEACSLRAGHGVGLGTSEVL
jgi:hypothetical protein